MSDDLVKQAYLALRQKNWSAVYRLALSLIGNDSHAASGYYFLGMFEKSRRQLSQASQAFERAIEMDRSRFESGIEMAEIHQRFGRHARAVKLVQDALETGFEDPFYLNKAGDILARAGLHKQAREAYENAHNFDASSPGIRMNLAGALSKTGELEKAEEIYLSLLKRFPDHQRMHYELAKLSRAKDRTHIDEMLAVLEKAGNDDRANIFLLFALGKELEDQGEWTPAFEYYVRGNRAAQNTAQRQGYNLQDDINTIKAISQHFGAEQLESRQAVSKRIACPIFIVGLPRSGTTLLEKIITGHVDIESIDESFFLESAIKSYCGLNPQQSLTPEHIGRLAQSSDTVKILEDYFAWSDYRREGRVFFIEKYPMNFQYLGLITRHVPNARILFMQRNPMDVCFALYKQPHFRFALGLEGLGEYYAAYAGLADHWEAVLGAKIHIVKYEDLVEDPQKTIRSTMDYIGLEYSDDLLNFHERKDSSASASSSQIREKLYSSSIGKWKNFSRELEPLKVVLSKHVNLS